MTTKTAETVDLFFQTMASEGVRAAVERYAAEDYTWWSAGAGNVEDRIGEFMDEFATQVSGAFELNVGTKTCGGDRVAVEVELRAELTDERLYHNKFHFLFEFRNDVIIKVSEYHDTRHAYETIGPTLRKVGFVDA
ncbi:nuclear transport factor 2 family protein [Rhodococcus opacus]|uniref:nuclear transport factor 2 family protein n=1 Tax=Rhodococcus opacus TaxID=37919 RepID=UPI002235C870|nr:nuclear transport factor 2 family protein [Rhodococcus opacus]UZG60008.1 nuclear transport factor 2 family protein [Rhodococcus opacus]